MVNEFSDVFSEELPDLSPVHELEFSVDLVTGVASISRVPCDLTLQNVCSVVIHMVSFFMR